MIIVTGGAGFIGSNLIKGLNLNGISDILVVDDLTVGQKCHNLADLDFIDYIDKDRFRQRLESNERLPAVEALFHGGACSDTTEWNGRYLMDVNFTYSKLLLHKCLDLKIPFFYASSASVYGNGSLFVESREYEKPLNMYAFSKFQFDQYVRSFRQMDSQVVGLRYFNVYGPREQHKGKMASVAFHLHSQLSNSGTIKLFDEYHGFGAGEQMRDFIHVDDVVAVNLWLLANPSVSGIFNVGTGRPQSFNDVAKAIISFYGRGEIEYIPFPDQLKGAYQSYTQADMTRLRANGYTASFMTVETGVTNYMHWLEQQKTSNFRYPLKNPG